jgi:hypothetical protein
MAVAPSADERLVTTWELFPWPGVMTYEEVSRSVRAVSNVTRSP